MICFVRYFDSDLLLAVDIVDDQRGLDHPKRVLVPRRHVAERRNVLDGVRAQTLAVFLGLRGL